MSSEKIVNPLTGKLIKPNGKIARNLLELHRSKTIKLPSKIYKVLKGGVELKLLNEVLPDEIQKYILEMYKKLKSETPEDLAEELANPAIINVKFKVLKTVHEETIRQLSQLKMKMSFEQKVRFLKRFLELVGGILRGKDEHRKNVELHKLNFVADYPINGDSYAVKTLKGEDVAIEFNLLCKYLKYPVRFDHFVYEDSIAFVNDLPLSLSTMSFIGFTKQLYDQFVMELKLHLICDLQMRMARGETLEVFKGLLNSIVESGGNQTTLFELNFKDEGDDDNHLLAEKTLQNGALKDELDFDDEEEDAQDEAIIRVINEIKNTNFTSISPDQIHQMNAFASTAIEKSLYNPPVEYYSSSEAITVNGSQEYLYVKFRINNNILQNLKNGIYEGFDALHRFPILSYMMFKLYHGIKNRQIYITNESVSVITDILITARDINNPFSYADVIARMSPMFLSFFV